MKRQTLTALLIFLPSMAWATLDTALIETTTGLNGTFNKTEDVFKVTAPRTDVKIAVDGWTMPPFMGLTSWAGFSAERGTETMVMGEFVLFALGLISRRSLLRLGCMEWFDCSRSGYRTCLAESGSKGSGETPKPTRETRVLPGPSEPVIRFCHASVLAAGIFTACAMSAETVNFDEAKPGSLPATWLGTQTGSGTAHWSVEPDATAPSKPNVLRQSGEATYPVCLKTDTKLKDGFVEVKFKPISGQEDQAGGLVWRAKDADNYYVARANALEDNVDIYHTVNGRRSQFDGVNVKVTPGQWHTLRVEFKGPNFVVLLDGKKVLRAKETTLGDVGMVGLWTKADSVTVFDDFAYGEK